MELNSRVVDHSRTELRLKDFWLQLFFQFGLITQKLVISSRLCQETRKMDLKTGDSCLGVEQT